MKLEQIIANYNELNSKMSVLNEQYNSKSKLLIASKTLTQEQINYIIENSNQKRFGETKVQDAVSKWSDIKLQYPKVKLHFIGCLQSNKIKQAASLFDVIETINSFEQMCKVSEEVAKTNKKIDLFLQVNIGDEKQKNGISLRDFDYVYNKIINADMMVSGIMCIPPKSGPSFFYFGYMKKIAKEYDIKEISMGMSNDFETAIKFGATQVRIGSFLTNNQKDIAK